MRDLEMSMQEKNNRFQREKHSLQIENKRLQEEIEKVSSPHGSCMFMTLSRRVSRELEEVLCQPVLCKAICAHLYYVCMCKSISICTYVCTYVCGK